MIHRGELRLLRKKSISIKKFPPFLNALTYFGTAVDLKNLTQDIIFHLLKNFFFSGF